jgi:murein DD-endopeptidase MepM/ murein hydrolase activator NlpD
MARRYYLWLLSLIIAILFIRFSFLQTPQVSHAQAIPLLSPPYFGTTTVWNIFDHEYPNYNGIPPGDVTNMMHNNGQRYDDPFDHGGGNIFCVGYSGHDGIDFGLRYKYVRAAHTGGVAEAGWDSPDHQLDYGLHVRLKQKLVV